MKLVATLLLLLVVAAACAAGWLWYSLSQPYQGFGQDGAFVEIPHGSSSRTAARLLQKGGVVRSATAFEIYSRRHPNKPLQAGEYFFDHAATGKDVFWKLANGDVYVQPFTVREGQTIFDIARELEAGKYMRAKDFLSAAKDPTLIHDIAPQAQSLEGFLFPATYHLSRTPVGTELVSDMVHKFREEWLKIAGTQASGNNPATADGRSIASIVTLASLVERETPKPQERPVVAGVFTNRLAKDMALQCDPTIIYALEMVKRYRGVLTVADLHMDSPYNTYVHTGLPPGPIGNPGEASLRAAFQPAQTDYLFFVANTHGGHFFAKNLAEHNKNVITYRRLLSGETSTASSTTVPTSKSLSKRAQGARQ